MAMELAVVVIGGLVLLAVPAGLKKVGEVNDRRRVHDWLRANTRDEPARSHKTSVEISDGTSLPVDRVHFACETDDRVLRSSKGAWSVWRKDPKSVYEVRGPLVLKS